MGLDCDEWWDVAVRPLSSDIIFLYRHCIHGESPFNLIMPQNRTLMSEFQWKIRNLNQRSISLPWAIWQDYGVPISRLIARMGRHGGHTAPAVLNFLLFRRSDMRTYYASPTALKALIEVRGSQYRTKI